MFCLEVLGCKRKRLLKIFYTFIYFCFPERHLGKLKKLGTTKSKQQNENLFPGFWSSRI